MGPTNEPVTEPVVRPVTRSVVGPTEDPVAELAKRREQTAARARRGESLNYSNLPITIKWHSLIVVHISFC